MSVQTAALLIQARALPPDELRKFLCEATRLLASAAQRDSELAEEHVEWRDLSAWRAQTFGDREMPNAVLEMRDDSRW